VRRAWLIVAALSLAGCSGVSNLDLTAGGRGIWQRPADVVSALELRPGASVADLGAGEGYFLPHLSDAVGVDGSVYAVDVEAEVVEALRLQFPAEETNVTAVLAASDDPKLPEAALDLVLLVNTYHHIEDRPAYFRGLQRNLRPGARVAIIEPNEELGGLLSLALDEGHTSSASNVENEMRAAGYVVAARHEFLPVQIFRVFRQAP
jgi:ubiquinone/menaquinone biosynthesis C-methylase UbiE